MSDELSELDSFNQRVGEGRSTPPARPTSSYEEAFGVEETEAPAKGKDASMWAVQGVNYFPCDEAIKELVPAQYEVCFSQNSGYFFKQTNAMTDDLIKLPDSASEEVIQNIETFWTKEDHFRSFGFLWKRGILLWGPPGCHAKGTKVIMHDGSVKNVEDVEVGDLLMGPDSKPRKVLELRQGREELFRITPVKGPEFVVNASHILSMERSRDRDGRFPSVINTSVREYLNLTKCAQRSLKLYREGVEFPPTAQNLPIDPYFLGLWLGDGGEDRTGITTADNEIKDRIYEEANLRGLHVNTSRKTSSICTTYTLATEVGGKNSLRSDLKSLGIFGNKRIPESYLKASRSDRLALLAGLIDTDGGYSTASWRESEKYKKKGYKGYFEIVQKREELSDDIEFLARSLGFGFNRKVCNKKCNNTGIWGIYQRMSIFGNIEDIPVRLPRKRALKGKPNKDPRRTGIKSIVSEGEGDFYGFTLNEDHLYLTSDFMVHHNSGKTATLQLVSDNIIKRGGISVYVNHPAHTAHGLSVMRRIEPNRPIVVMMEDLDALLQQHGEQDVLALLDGELQIDNVCFVATTNYPERLDKRIVNRPSRFDIVKLVAMPNEEARRIYLVAKNQRLKDNPEELAKWIKGSEGFSIAHLKELIVSVEVFEVELEFALKRLQKMMGSSPKSTDTLPRTGQYN